MQTEEKQLAGYAPVAMADGSINRVPLTKDTMETLLNFFVLKAGVYVFSVEKQAKFLARVRS